MSNQMTQPNQSELEEIQAILEEHHSIVTDELGEQLIKALAAWHAIKLNDAMWDLRQFLLEEGRQDLLMKYDKPEKEAK